MEFIWIGNNGTINGQGKYWWVKYRSGGFKNITRPYTIEIMFSQNVQISNITIIDSPAWNIHPVYCNNVIVKGVTILAPIDSPNTDGINPGKSISHATLYQIFLTGVFVFML